MPSAPRPAKRRERLQAWRDRSPREQEATDGGAQPPATDGARPRGSQAVPGRLHANVGRAAVGASGFVALIISIFSMVHMLGCCTSDAPWSDAAVHARALANATAVVVSETGATLADWSSRAVTSVSTVLPYLFVRHAPNPRLGARHRDERTSHTYAGYRNVLLAVCAVVCLVGAIYAHSASG